MLRGTTALTAVIAAILAAPATAAGGGAEEWTMRASGVRVHGALPEGWVAVPDDAYASIAGRLVAPSGRAAIAVTVFPAWPAVRHRILAERDAAALRRLGFTVTVGTGGGGRPELRGRDPAGRSQLLLRYLTVGGRAVALVLTCPTGWLPALAPAFDEVAASLQGEQP